MDSFYRPSLRYACTLPALLMVAGCLLAPLRAESRTLTFDGVLAKAIENAYAIQIADKSVEINQYRLQEVRSLYYPSLSMRLHNEYISIIDDDGPVTVGDYANANTYSTYQSSLTTSLTYQLYDFGIRDLKHENAKRDIRIAQLDSTNQQVEIQIEVLEVFAQGLTLSQRIGAGRDIMAKQKELYRIGQELREAGTHGRHQTEGLALNLAEAVSQLDDLQIQYQEALNTLEYYTGEDYVPESTRFADLMAPDVMPDPPMPDLAPEIKAIDEAIAKKEADCAIARREMLPNIYLSSSYRMFGSDEGSLIDSVSELESRDASVAVITEWPIFTGFRKTAESRRLEAEAQQLRLQRTQKLAELKRETRKAYQTFHLHQSSRETLRARRNEVGQHGQTLKRLSANRIMDRMEYLQNEIRLIEQGLDIDLKAVDRAVAGIKLQIWQKWLTN